MTRSDFSFDNEGQQYGDRSCTVTFDNDGDFYPFLKYYVYRRGVSSNRERYIGSPQCVMLRVTGSGGTRWNLAQSSSGTVAKVNDNSIKFWMALGHPKRLTVDTTNFIDPVYSDDDKPIGIR